MNELINAKQLVCERDDRVLFNDLSFQIPKASLVRITGPNGSGKTTLMRFLVGLGQSVEGKVELNQDIAQSANRLDGESVLYLGHKPAISLSLSPIENLMFLATQRGLEVDQKTGFLALEKVGLRGFEEQECDTLSAGQKRRVALAQLFLPQDQCKLWFLDEPFTALDVAAVAMLEQHIIEFSQQGGAVVFITHHQFANAQVTSIDLGSK